MSHPAPPDPFEALRAARVAPTRPGLAVFRIAFVPLVLAIAIVPWVGGQPFARHPMPVVLPFAMLVIWLAEQVFPTNAAWNVRPIADGLAGWKRLGRDLVYLLVVAQASAWLVGQLAARLDPVLARAGIALGSAGLWPAQAPVVVRIGLAFLLVEFGSYWLHRAAHHVAILWRFHETHHGITELNGLKALRTHPVENVLFALVRTTPLLLLGVAADDVITVACVGGILGFLSHANVDVRPGALGWIVNYPGFHAVHHSAEPEESRRNFGCHSVIWDRVFGTFVTHAKEPLELGVRPVGPRTLWQELGWPLYRRNRGAP